jgi:hypothetical protein
MTQALGGWTRDGGVLGALGYLGLLALAGLLERVQYRLKADEGRAWWASNGRDVLNAVALGAVSAGLWLQGFRGPLVVCIAGTVVLLLSLSQMRLESSPRSTLWSVLGALLLGLPALLRPGTVARVFTETLGALIP